MDAADAWFDEFFRRDVEDQMRRVAEQFEFRPVRAIEPGESTSMGSVLAVDDDGTLTIDPETPADVAERILRDAD